jgi:hypothetical protein
LASPSPNHFVSSVATIAGLAIGFMFLELLGITDIISRVPRLPPMGCYSYLLTMVFHLILALIIQSAKRETIVPRYNLAGVYKPSPTARTYRYGVTPAKAGVTIW